MAQITNIAGHIFHRDCIELRVASGATTCPICSAICQKTDVMIRLFTSYDEDDYDRNLLRDVSRYLLFTPPELHYRDPMPQRHSAGTQSR